MSSVEDDLSINDINKILATLPISRKIYSSYNQSDTDTAGSDGCFRPKTSFTNSHRVRQKRKSNNGYYSDNSSAKNALLPPIGVFWDIENCQVPRGRSAMCIAQMIRNLYFDGYREAEFVVVCDVRKETNQVIQELCDAQVNLIHVSSTSKNAADEKLRQCMRRFADTYGAPSAILLISGDVNFAADLSDLRHRKKIHVILLHKQNVSKALILCASENHCFTELTNSVPIRPTLNKNLVSPGSSPGPVELAIRNLPISQDSGRVRNRLRQLSDNCGGRVARLDSENGFAVIRFASDDHALRAQKRMNGEDVFGNKILATQPSSMSNTPNRKVTQHCSDLLDTDEGYQTMTSSSIGYAPLSPLPPMPHLFLNQDSKFESKQFQELISQAEQVQKHCSSYQQNSLNFNKASGSHFKENNLVDQNDFRSKTAANFNKAKSLSSSLKSDSIYEQCLSKDTYRRNNQLKINKHSNFSSKARARSASPWQSNTLSQSSSNSSDTDLQIQENDYHFCRKHCSVDSLYYLDLYKTTNVMPSVKIQLKKLNANLCKLLETHNGSLSLISLNICYNSEFEPFVVDQASGVMLEHLVSCCTGMSVKKSSLGVKHIISTIDQLKNEAREDLVAVSSENACNLQQLSKEFILLLRSCPKCLLPFDNIVQTYHNYFGKQCKTADYGFKKLIDLLGALSSVIQVIGEGKNRLITLTHKVQKRLFASDLCKVLRVQANMQLFLSELPRNFAEVLEHPFDITNYGVCFISDMLDDLSESIVVKNKQLDGDVILSRPKRNLCDIEIKKINDFKLEIVELMIKEPEQTMYLNKFASSYHQHFGHQCKLSDYGFDKLIELFEAMSDIIEIIECNTGCNNERKISLKSTHSNIILYENKADFKQTSEILLQSPPPSELPKPSLSLLTASCSKDNDEDSSLSTFQHKRKSRLAAIFPSTSLTNFM